MILRVKGNQTALVKMKSTSFFFYICDGVVVDFICDRFSWSRIYENSYLLADGAMVSTVRVRIYVATYVQKYGSKTTHKPLVQPIVYSLSQHQFNSAF
jgi:hypothetical protein